MEKKPNLDLPSDSDFEHLRLLSIFHYVLAAVIALASLVPLIHLTVGVLMLSGAITPDEDGAEAVIALVGWMFTVIPALMIIMGLTVSVLVAMAGKRLGRRTNYTFCLVIAAVSCTFFPIGTVLGVFTLLVLMRPGMKDCFES